jgi:hypothetical protein
MTVIYVLLGIALLLENVIPWLLHKFFPQEIMSPAPDVPVRPKRTAARNDAHVDAVMEHLPNVHHVNARSAKASAASDSLVATTGAAQTMATPELESTFDYDEFRPAAREDLQSVQVSQGVPDVFENETANAHA